MFSIGGASFASNWDQALQQDAVGLAKNAAAIAQKYGVGIEIDYEQDSSASMGLLTTFVEVYFKIIYIFLYYILYFWKAICEIF